MTTEDYWGLKNDEDSAFRLEPEIRDRVLSIYDPDALERFLSLLPAESRNPLIEELFTSPGADDKSPPQFSGEDFRDPALRQALLDVFAPLHRMVPEMARMCPFAES